jgi:acetolactate synthase-1/2/3 large subunit
MTTGRPGAAHIGLPYDVQQQFVDEADIWAEPEYGRYPARRTGPAPDAVDAAAELIAKAKQSLFICGGGVVISGAEHELEILAKKIDAPIATTISGQGSIADDHLLSLGVVGSNGGTEPTRRVVDAADLIVFVGCRAGSVTTERWRHPAPGAARIVHIDVDPGVMGTNYRPDAAIVGDAKLCLTALIAAVAKKEASGAQQLVSTARKEKYLAFNELAKSNEMPIRPERIVDELQKVLPEDAVIVADPGTACPYFSAYYEIRDTGRTFISNRAHGALGFALPAVVGAYYGRSGSKCVAIMGDGSFGMSVGELETIKRLDIPVTMVVISNSVFGWIKAGQRSGYEGRYFSVDFTRTDHAAVAEAYGIKTWTVRDPAELGPALKAAVESAKPTLVDVITQPLQEARAPVSEWVA